MSLNENPYRQPATPPVAPKRNKWLIGCLIALAVPAVMFLCLLIVIIGVCGHR